MSAEYDYNQEADIMEVFFADIEATASVYLTPDILLHWRVEDEQPVSLILNNFSDLARPGEYGPRAWPLGVERWPDALRPAVWRIVNRAPVKEWLMVSSYQPPHTRRAIPLAAVHPIPTPAV